MGKVEIPAGSVLVKTTAADDRKMVMVFRDVLGEKFDYVVEGENLTVEIVRGKDEGKEGGGGGGSDDE